MGQKVIATIYACLAFHHREINPFLDKELCLDTKHTYYFLHRHHKKLCLSYIWIC